MILMYPKSITIYHISKFKLVVSELLKIKMCIGIKGFYWYLVLKNSFTKI